MHITIGLPRLQGVFQTIRIKYEICSQTACRLMTKQIGVESYIRSSGMLECSKFLP